MTNLEALKSTCNAICNTFYPDNSTLNLMLLNADIDATATATPRDANIVKIALTLVSGFVESGKSMGGVSISTNENAVIKSITKWCSDYGFNASEFIKLSSISNGSKLW